MAPNPAAAIPVAFITQALPYLQGLGALSTVASGLFSIINGIRTQAEEKAFHDHLLAYLDGFQKSLDKVSQQLDQISQDLVNIEAGIKGLELDPALNAIETWGDDFAALDPTDVAGVQKLAADMMNTADPKNSLEGYLNLIHNNLVGNLAGRPALDVLGMSVYLLLSARILQGLHLLVFACANDKVQSFNIDTFLAGWAKKIDQESRTAAAHDTIAATFNPGDVNKSYSAKDALFLSQVVQPQIPNVTLLATKGGATLELFSGTLTLTQNDPGFEGQSNNGLGIDWNNKQIILPTDPTFNQIDPIWGDHERWMLVMFQPIVMMGSSSVQFWLESAHRHAETDTVFLGAYIGQQFALTKTKDIITSLHDGATDSASLLMLQGNDPTLAKRTIATTDLNSLTSISSMLWRFMYVDQSHIRIAFFQWDVDRDGTPSSTGNPVLQPGTATTQWLYLTLDSAGAWTTTTDETAAVLEVRLHDVQAVPLASPYSMSPTPIEVALSFNKTPSKTILLHTL